MRSRIFYKQCNCDATTDKLFAEPQSSATAAVFLCVCVHQRCAPLDRARRCTTTVAANRRARVSQRINAPSTMNCESLKLIENGIDERGAFMTGRPACIFRVRYELPASCFCPFNASSWPPMLIFSSSILLCGFRCGFSVYRNSVLFASFR